ncbi:unnamed protein product, partial [Porites lobata]
MKRKVFHGDENRRKKRQWSRQKCGHCEQFLGHTQYHEHRRLYFNSTLNQWTTVHDLRQKKCEPEDVPGSSSSESEGKISCHSRLLDKLELCIDLFVLLFTKFSNKIQTSLVFLGEKMPILCLNLLLLESDEPSSSESSSDEGTDYADSDEDVVMEEMLQTEEVELPQPTPVGSNLQCRRVLLTWLVYFVLVWQYKHYISDNGIEQLLRFMRQLLFCIGQIVKEHSDFCLVLAANLPTTLYSARKFLNIDRDNFVQYVVCPKCTKLYHKDDIVINDGGRTVARTCENVPFPRSKRPRTCGSQLSHKVVLKNGNVKFYALKTYCYKSVIDSLEDLLKRPGVEEQCVKWKRRTISDDLYADIVQPPQFVMASSGPLLGKESIWSDLTSICFEKHYKLGRLDQEELSALGTVYVTLYPHITVASLNLPSLYKRYKSLSVCGERYGSTAGTRLCPYARIIASWCDKDGVVRPGMLRPGIIRYFIVHSLEIEGCQKSHAFAVVNWLKSSDEDFGFGNPLSVWRANDFEHSGPAVFLPVQRIHCKFLSADK